MGLWRQAFETEICHEWECPTVTWHFPPLKIKIFRGAVTTYNPSPLSFQTAAGEGELPQPPGFQGNAIYKMIKGKGASMYDIHTELIEQLILLWQNEDVSSQEGGGY